jgi:hypothetical protein
MGEARLFYAAGGPLAAPLPRIVLMPLREVATGGGRNEQGR